MSGRRMVGPSAWVFGAAGAFIGVVAAWLVSQGNPGNMGLCIACFLRDTVGFFGGTKANMGAVAYIRPEIVGLMLGAMAASLATKEFRPRGGSSTPLRFVLGFIFMTSALIFLGCTVRAWLRLAGGDLNAVYGILGIIVGVTVGALFLKSGYNLGRSVKLPAPVGWLGPVLAIVLLALALASSSGSAPMGFTVTKAKAFATGTTPPAVFLKGPDGKPATILKPEGATLAEDGSVVGADGAVVASAEAVAKAKPQPGGKRAPLYIALVAGLVLGVVAQRSRFCSIGGIRDVVLVRRFDLLFGVIGLLVGAFVANLVLGQFNLGFENQPIAHTDALGNFAAMTVAGLAAVMLGGCPFRQVIMSGEGDADAFAAVLGMMGGALFAHWYGIASSPKGLSQYGWPALAVMAVVLVAIALIKRERTA
ncbi:YedE family putative selenium transporter [Coriobacteriia bacterium Es71-Z0120]|uniref:YedE family putative selenium transporter n=1 Tax=Parvivirga hydrogeniphila TaxID=2939460 RepID=UPI002260C085|nr:YedE family putative selenium transporter [Parvivirga hydrogeniphila]MCL4078045.1 YedE family putative selenium transporter [Parvivirga hydrogeniphila]